MAENYRTASSGKLKLKGENDGRKSKDKKKSSKKRKSSSSDATNAKNLDLEDVANHAGGWRVESFDQVTGTVFIELNELMYLHGLDNGLFVIGAAHQLGERPEQCEILTAIRVDDSHVAFKSAFGKYLSVNANGLLIGRSDAISPNEYFEIVIDFDYDGRKIYIKATNGKYLGVNNEGDIVFSSSNKEEKDLVIRSLQKKEDEQSKAKKALPAEEQSEDLTNVELNYVKKFQAFQDKRIRLCKDDPSELKAAKETGELHEKLLDRREKTKSDRYCK